MEVSDVDTLLYIIWRPTNFGLHDPEALFFEWSLSQTRSECISDLSITGIRKRLMSWRHLSQCLCVMSAFPFVSIGFVLLYYISMSPSFSYWVKAVWWFCRCEACKRKEKKTPCELFHHIGSKKVVVQPLGIFYIIVQQSMCFCDEIRYFWYTFIPFIS